MCSKWRPKPFEIEACGCLWRQKLVGERFKNHTINKHQKSKKICQKCTQKVPRKVIFLCQKHPRASISNVFGRHLKHIWNKYGQVEIAILCRRVLKNQALEGLYFTLFRHFHAQILGTFNFHASFDDWSPFYTFVHPLETHF